MTEPFKLCILFGDAPDRPPAEIAPDWETVEIPVSLLVKPFESSENWSRRHHLGASSRGSRAVAGCGRGHDRHRQVAATVGGAMCGCLPHAGDHHRKATEGAQLPGTGVLGGLPGHPSRRVRTVPETCQRGAALHGLDADRPRRRGRCPRVSGGVGRTTALGLGA